MEIVVTIAELSEVVNSLNNLVKIPISAKYAYRFQKVAKILQFELQEVKKQSEDLVRRLGEPTEDGSQIRVKEENMKKFSEERNALFLETITVNFDPMPISDFSEKITITDMAWLEKFFVDDTDTLADREVELVSQA